MMKRVIQFPNPLKADDDGLVAVGGELTTDFLLSAYSQGIFPWFNKGEPVLWWSPNPRMVLYPSEFKLSKSLKQTLNSQKFEIRADTVFKTVIHKCAKSKRRDQTGTWISEDIIKAYTALHEKGHAHSIETFKDGILVGGLYGVSLGKAFFGESMFFEATDASKVALYTLCQLLLEWNYHFIDVQQSTQHLKSLGAVDLSRKQFMNELQEAISLPGKSGKWSI